MLFNSYQFIFYYLPIVFFGFFLIARNSRQLSAMWLAAASLFFYGWWNPKFVLLIMISIGFNYSMGYGISKTIRTGMRPNYSKALLICALATNLLLLGYFKYMNFFIRSANHLTGVNWSQADILLPLGISFFTFTQIAFLVDTYRGIAREYNFIHYVLFVTYFPHLIAGPVLHHKQMMPQFGDAAIYRPSTTNIGLGLTLFCLGLAKKVLLADTFSHSVGPVFADATRGIQPVFLAAWEATLSYTLQIYFDFSGYSDMAVGLSLMFSVHLPMNFYSPYQAWNIIEFWRRWHITLSQFLRDYLYIPLGGNRLGHTRRYFNIGVTMLLGGLWHGANWTFVIWGALHGLLLILNHFWHALRNKFGVPARTRPFIGWRISGVALTFFCVVITWVFFRADNIDSAILVLQGMSTLSQATLPPTRTALLLGLGIAIVLLAPNTQKIMSHIERHQSGKIGTIYAMLIAVIATLCVMNFGQDSEFIYFQF